MFRRRCCQNHAVFRNSKFDNRFDISVSENTEVPKPCVRFPQNGQAQSCQIFHLALSLDPTQAQAACFQQILEDRAATLYARKYRAWPKSSRDAFDRLSVSQTQALKQDEAS